MFTPGNEQGVIVRFVQCAIGKENIKIIDIRTAFPDAVISINGEVLKVEFEFLSSNFLAHGHNVLGCDIVICWENDLAESNFPLPVISLKDNNLDNLSIVLADEAEKELFFWKTRAIRAERKIVTLEKQIEGNATDYEIVYTCRQCERTFGTQAALNAHMRSHK